MKKTIRILTGLLVFSFALNVRAGTCENFVHELQAPGSNHLKFTLHGSWPTRLRFIECAGDELKSDEPSACIMQFEFLSGGIPVYSVVKTVVKFENVPFANLATFYEGAKNRTLEGNIYSKSVQRNPRYQTGMRSFKKEWLEYSVEDQNVIYKINSRDLGVEKKHAIAIGNCKPWSE